MKLRCASFIILLVSFLDSSMAAMEDFDVGKSMAEGKTPPSPCNVTCGRGFAERFQLYCYNLDRCDLTVENADEALPEVEPCLERYCPECAEWNVLHGYDTRDFSLLLPNGTKLPVITNTDHRPYSADYDYVSGKLLMVQDGYPESSHHGVWKANLNPDTLEADESSMEQIRTLPNTGHVMSVDRIHQLIITEVQSHGIYRLKYDGSDFYAVVGGSEFSETYTMAIDVRAMNVFWWQSDDSIYKCSYNVTSKQSMPGPVFTQTGLYGGYRRMAVDHDNYRLYFLDASTTDQPVYFFPLHGPYTGPQTLVTLNSAEYGGIHSLNYCLGKLFFTGELQDTSSAYSIDVAHGTVARYADTIP